MRSIIVDQCLAALKRDEVKTEIRSWITPLADFVLEEMQPYLYIFGVFIIVLFYNGLSKALCQSFFSI